MSKTKKFHRPNYFIVTALCCVLFLGNFFNASASSGDDKEGFNPGDMITHHIKDAYEWHFFDGHYGTLYLPVILYTNHGFLTFSSANLYDEHHHPVHYKGVENHHGKIVSVEEDLQIIVDLSITKNVASMFISVILMLWLFTRVAQGYKKNEGRAPKGVQAFFEPIIIFIRDEVAKPNIGARYERFLPFLLTLFFFIWFNNLLGLIPGGANLTGNIAFTMVLAVVVLSITLGSSRKAYWKHIFATPGVPFPVLLILIPIELIGILTKPFSLMMRLFANITAGHIIILSLFSLIFLFKSSAVAVVSVPFAIFMNFLELFVALLQAYVFTLLSAMYFGSAVEDDHH